MVMSVVRHGYKVDTGGRRREQRGSRLKTGRRGERGDSAERRNCHGGGEMRRSLLARDRKTQQTQPSANANAINTQSTQPATATATVNSNSSKSNSNSRIVEGDSQKGGGSADSEYYCSRPRPKGVVSMAVRPNHAPSSRVYRNNRRWPWRLGMAILLNSSYLTPIQA